MSQQQQQQPYRRPQQNGNVFANATNRNNYSQNNRNSRNTTQSATNTTQNKNWDINWNQVRQYQAGAILAEQVKRMQYEVAMNLIAAAQHQNLNRIQTQAQPPIQQRPMQSNNVNANANVAAREPTVMAKPTVSVNSRLNINHNTVPVHTETSKPIAKESTGTVKPQHEKRPAQDESDWDEPPSQVIDLTKSSQKTIYTESKAYETSNRANGRVANDTSDAKWQHDLYDVNQPISKSTTNTTKQITERSIPAPKSVQPQVKNDVADQEKKNSSSWLTYPANTNEPARKSEFERLVQPGLVANRLQNIQSRLTVTPTAIEKLLDTVDFMTQKRQEQEQTSKLILSREIEQKVSQYFI